MLQCRRAKVRCPPHTHIKAQQHPHLHTHTDTHTYILYIYIIFKEPYLPLLRMLQRRRHLRQDALRRMAQRARLARPVLPVARLELLGGLGKGG